MALPKWGCHFLYVRCDQANILLQTRSFTPNKRVHFVSITLGDVVVKASFGNQLYLRITFSLPRYKNRSHFVPELSNLAFEVQSAR